MTREELGNLMMLEISRKKVAGESEMRLPPSSVGEKMQ